MAGAHILLDRINLKASLRCKETGKWKESKMVGWIYCMSLPKDKVHSLIFYTSQPTIQLNKPILVSVHIIQQKLNFTDFPKMVTDPRSLQESEGREMLNSELQ